MYGTGRNLLMDVPHILISSNFIFDQNALSNDRWRIFQMKNRQLVNITKKAQQIHQKTNKKKVSLKKSS